MAAWASCSMLCRESIKPPRGFWSVNLCFLFFFLSILIPALHASLLSVTRLKEGKKDSKKAEECAERTGQAKKGCSCKEVRSFGMSDVRVGFDRKYIMECSGDYEAVGREQTWDTKTSQCWRATNGGSPKGAFGAEGRVGGRRRAQGLQKQYGEGAKGGLSAVLEHVKKLTQIGDESRGEGEGRSWLKPNGDWRKGLEKD